MTTLREGERQINVKNAKFESGVLTAAGAIDRHHGLHILETLLSRHFRLAIFKDAFGQVIGLARELDGILFRVLVVDGRLALDAHAETLALVRESGLGIE